MDMWGLQILAWGCVATDDAPGKGGAITQSILRQECLWALQQDRGAWPDNLTIFLANDRLIHPSPLSLSHLPDSRTGELTKTCAKGHSGWWLQFQTKLQVGRSGSQEEGIGCNHWGQLHPTQWILGFMCTICKHLHMCKCVLTCSHLFALLYGITTVRRSAGNTLGSARLHRHEQPTPLFLGWEFKKTLFRGIWEG
uniref:Uncharacterized protein n=1 Tax=Eutreptiella gymnastica TaxID=73025 RepID=A0A7S1N2V4_9EUGL